jgi:predicted enzyme related to lactoylglutathione lyase
MTIRLGYAIHFVADMDQAVAFYRDTIGLELRFTSPGWSEFATGATTLALHPASPANPPGITHLGLQADDIAELHRRLMAAGVRFTRAPTPEHGVTLAEFVDCEGARVSLSG